MDFYDYFYTCMRKSTYILLGITIKRPGKTDVSILGSFQMEHEEDTEIRETREKVRVTAQRREFTYEEEEEISEELVEPKIWTMPRRWYVYK
jgi:hypothetical protein